jgi:hypothetical protein
VLVACFLSCGSAHAQKQTSLASQVATPEEFYAGVRQGRAVTRVDSVLATIATVVRHIPNLRAQVDAGGPCLTELFQYAWIHRNEVSAPITQSILSSEFTNQDSIISPKAHFTIYFDNTGANAATREYVDSIAAMSDRAFDFEINTLGYPKPPYPFADSTFHTHLTDFGVTGKYGYTQPTTDGDLGPTPSGLEKWRTFNVIDNDFSEQNYTTHGYDAARVTVFHEFQHVIQYGVYGISSLPGPDGFFVDSYFKEMTAVWMESLSNPDVKDYIQYIPGYLTTIKLSINGGVNRGYSQAIWLQFLEKTYGPEIVKDMWTRYSNVLYSDNIHAVVCSMQDAIAAKGSNFQKEYMRFGAALFFTGRQFKGTSIFPDAELFQYDSLAHILATTPGQPTAIQFGALPASLNFIDEGFGNDTVAVVIARDTDFMITSDASATINGPSPYSYKTAYQFSNAFADTLLALTVQTSASGQKVFPQPYTVGTAPQNALWFFASAVQPVDVQLDIFSMNLDKIAHVEKSAVGYLDSWYETWNGVDDLGRIVPSGVYLYSMMCDGVQTQGKFVVVHKN